MEVPETDEINDQDVHTNLILSTQSDDVFFNGSLMMLQMRDDFRHRVGTQWSDIHGTTLSERCAGFNLNNESNDEEEAQKMNQALWFDNGKGLAITNSVDISNGGVLEFTIRTWISFLIHFLRGLTRVTYTKHYFHPSRIPHSQ